MDAIISGSAGVAIIVDGDELASIHSEAVGKRIPRSPADLDFLLGDSRNLEVAEDVSQEYVVEALRRAQDREEALELVLILMDSDLSVEVRQEAADVLESLLESPWVEEYLGAVLYAKELPEGTDIAEAIGHCVSAPSGRIATFLLTLKAEQASISKVRLQWDTIPMESFGARAERESFRAAVVQAGLFRKLVECVASGEGFDGFLFDALVNPAGQRFRNWRVVLRDWIAGFLSSSEEVGASAKVVAEHVVRPRQERRKKGRRGKEPAKTMLKKVTRWKAFIIQSLKHQRIGNARKHVEELVEYQREHGRREHICKSLCDLAMAAKELMLYGLQLEWTEQAVNANLDDEWALVQHADALKNMGRLAESLKVYEQVIAEHPESVVAKNGRAEVLKAMNRLPEALESYEQVIAEHPESIVARNGRACVLASIGQWEEALVGLTAESPVTEQDWIGYHIRGMILLRRGDLDSAIRIFEEGVQMNPRPAKRDYFRTALAVAYLKKQEYGLASNVLEEVSAPILQTPADILRLHAFGRQGDCERTTKIYEALPDKPGPVLADLQAELHRQYVAYETPQQSEDWLVDREIQYLLLAA